MADSGSLLGPELPADTYRVSELGQALENFLGEAFSGLWVGGEVQRPFLSRNGHLYFQLVEKGPAQRVIGSVSAVIFRNDLLRVRRFLRAAGVNLEDGQSLRCLGRVGFYAPQGQLQLIVNEVDPLFALGALAHKRKQTLMALAQAGLLDANAGLELPAVPLALGVVTSAQSAAAEDLLATLRSSGYRFSVTLIDTAVAGQRAEHQVTLAIARLDRAVRSGRLRLDAYVLVRGGGARSDLQVFDSPRIAEAVARAERPVLTGLGHEIDQAIADRVAHRAFKTPTGVAEFLCQRVAAEEARLEHLRRQLLQAARRRAVDARRAEADARGRLRLSGQRLLRAGDRLHHLAERLSASSRLRLDRALRDASDLGRRLGTTWPRRLERAEAARRQRAQRLVEVARARTVAERRRLDATARLCAELSPERVLARGFSLTRDHAGRIVRSSAEVAAGDLLRTALSAGFIDSRVEATRERS